MAAQVIDFDVVGITSFDNAEGNETFSLELICDLVFMQFGLW